MWILFTGDIMICLRFLTQLIQLKELKTQSGLREQCNFARSISDRVESFPVLRLHRYNKCEQTNLQNNNSLQPHWTIDIFPYYNQEAIQGNVRSRPKQLINLSNLSELK